jgi:uncharacterized protein
MPDIPPLPEETILLVEVGSTAHGTGLPGGEDHDEMAVFVESASEVFGLQETGGRSIMLRSQPEGIPSEPGDTDRTLHPLRRFLRLAVSGNPSILMSLWAPVLSATPDGLALQGLGEALVGRHLIARYVGYMQSQVLKLLNAREGGVTLRGREGPVSAFGYDTKYAMHAARLGWQGLELLRTRRLSLPVGGEAVEWLRAVRRGEVAFAEWQHRTEELESELRALAGDESIPEGPNRPVIERWSVATHLRHFSATGG